jgi:hypothetical protein
MRGVQDEPQGLLEATRKQAEHAVGSLPSLSLDFCLDQHCHDCLLMRRCGSARWKNWASASLPSQALPRKGGLREEADGVDNAAHRDAGASKMCHRQQLGRRSALGKTAVGAYCEGDTE